MSWHVWLYQYISSRKEAVLLLLSFTCIIHKLPWPVCCESTLLVTLSPREINQFIQSTSVPSGVLWKDNEKDLVWNTLFVVRWRVCLSFSAQHLVPLMKEDKNPYERYLRMSFRTADPDCAWVLNLLVSFWILVWMQAQQKQGASFCHGLWSLTHLSADCSLRATVSAASSFYRANVVSVLQLFVTALASGMFYIIAEII